MCTVFVPLKALLAWIMLTKHAYNASTLSGSSLISPLGCGLSALMMKGMSISSVTATRSKSEVGDAVPYTLNFSLISKIYI